MDVLLEADAMLIGRVMYEGFAAAWPSRSGDPCSDTFNAMPKYVAAGLSPRAALVRRRFDKQARAFEGRRAVRDPDQPAPSAYDGLDDAQRAQITGEHMEIRDEPGCVTGGWLQPVDTAMTVRIEDGEALVTDGPLANTKESFGGYPVGEADDLDTSPRRPLRRPWRCGRTPAARTGSPRTPSLAGGDRAQPPSSSRRRR